MKREQKLHQTCLFFTQLSRFALSRFLHFTHAGLITATGDYSDQIICIFLAQVIDVHAGHSGGANRILFSS